MSLAIGITGLAQAGKSTLFQALTAASDAEGRKSANKARAPVPDARLWKLSEIFKPKKTTPATIDFVDMPAGGSGGLGGQALGEIRTATALLEVVRAFEHPYLGAPQPLKDLESFELELMLADLKIVEGKLERRKKLVPGEAEILEKLQGPLAEGDARKLPQLSPEEKKLTSGLGLLSIKPRLFAANLPEGGNDAAVEVVKKWAQERGAQSFSASALVEAEVAQLPAEERQLFLEELGIQEPAVHALVRACYAQLGLLTFLTAGEDECRTWTVDKGARAPQAAGVIHSDLERGFIRAEVIHFDEFIACGGSMDKAKAQGKLRVEGKEYIVMDGDILNIRFNV